MEMRVLLPLLVVAVFCLAEEACEPTTPPQCYKSSTSVDEDFICEWEEKNPEQRPTYTLYIWDSENNRVSLSKNNIMTSQKILLFEEILVWKKFEMWVQSNLGNLACNSSNVSAILECRVKYSKPNITNMERKDGELSLTLEKPKDDKVALYDIRWREKNSEWQNKTFKTKENTQDIYRLQLQKPTVYQIQLRRQAILKTSPCNETANTLWSDWTSVLDVPTEIHQQLVMGWVENTEKKRNGSRNVTITWDAPLAEQSAGGVKYNLSLSIWPCETHHRTKLVSVNRSYQLSITYSEARISLIAVNRVGSSPPTEMIIPAVKHLNYCEQAIQKEVGNSKENCWEWYKLEDGLTRPRIVNSSKTKKNFNNEVEAFVRHYYFHHIMKKKLLYTHSMCPFYSVEAAPSKGPENVSISPMTISSAVVRWSSIPVAKQRGFLQKYVIYVSAMGTTEIHEVSAEENSFLLKDLHRANSYTVSIAGRTKAGEGPNSTVNFESLFLKMDSSWQTVLCACGVAVVVVMCICTLVAKKLKSKVLPEVPSPVILSAKLTPSDEQDFREVTEVVDEVILLQQLKLSNPVVSVSHEQSTLLENIRLAVNDEEEEEEQEEEITLSTKSCYSNHSYKGQLLHLSETLHVTNLTLQDLDSESTYRNGVFIETKDCVLTPS